MESLKNVILKDVLTGKAQILSISPDTGANGTWMIGTLEPGQTFEASMMIQIPVTDIFYNSSSGVDGQGFANVYNDFRTGLPNYDIRNCAYASASGVGTVSSCATVNVLEETGTDLQKREHGSGSYSAEELNRMRTDNKSLKYQGSLKASYRSSSFKLPDRKLDFDSRVSEDIRTKNHVTGATSRESYRYATDLDRNSTINLDKNGSTTSTEVDFIGAGHFGYLKKDGQPKAMKADAFDSQENLVGAFHVSETFDEYGSGVVSNRSITGVGSVSSDKRIGDRQRSYEHGTGTYRSDELIETYSAYIAKDVKATAAPTSYDYSKSFKSEPNLLWEEGIWTRSSKYATKGGYIAFNICPSNRTQTYASYIGEAVRDAVQLEKETTVYGLSRLESNMSFTGTAEFRTILEDGSGRSAGTLLAANHSAVYRKGDRIEIADVYSGQYQISRKIELKGASRYNRPHIYVRKDGRLLNGWVNRENSTIAEYNITIQNDGSSALGPIYVKDQFPKGAKFLNASLRPSQTGEGYANWTLTYLPSGGVAQINLHLLMPGEDFGSVNRVYAAGGYGSSFVTSANYFAIEGSWLPCCSGQIELEKTAALDAHDPTLIYYRLMFINNGNRSVVATVSDILPEGVQMVNATSDPVRYDTNYVEWVLPSVQPGEIASIEYLARAYRDGSYTNRAHVEAVYLDGSGSDSTDASASVVVEGSGRTASTTRYTEWQPPDWGFSTSEEGLSQY